MLTLIIIATSIYLLKMLVDYVHRQTGMVSISGIKGFLFGFDVEENVVDYKEQDSEQIKYANQITVEIALFFISIVLMWREEVDSETEGNL